MIPNYDPYAYLDSLDISSLIKLYSGMPSSTLRTVIASKISAKQQMEVKR